MRKKIYIAGPLTRGVPARNVFNAMVMGNRLVDLGYSPFIPHLLYFVDSICPHQYETWMDVVLQWVRQSDGLLRLPGESPGSDREVALATELGIPVFTDIDTLLRYFPKDIK